MTNTVLRIKGSEELFTAPDGYSVERAVSWLSRLVDRSVDRWTQLGPAAYLCSNGKRGVNKRTCVIEVVS